MTENIQDKYTLDRVGLKKWIELEDIRYNIRKAAESGNTDELASQLCLHVSVAFCIPYEDVEKLDWDEVAYAFQIGTLACVPKNDYAILKSKSKDEKEISWDYPGRTFYLWANMLARAYGWTLDYIAELDFDAAIALMQEILVDQQTEKEWQWMLSEIAYPYNPTKKVSEFKALPRPSWMSEKRIVAPVKNVKILKSMLPVGAVVKMDGTLENVVH